MGKRWQVSEGRTGRDQILSCTFCASQRLLPSRIGSFEAKDQEREVIMRHRDAPMLYLAAIECFNHGLRGGKGAR